MALPASDVGGGGGAAAAAML